MSYQVLARKWRPRTFAEVVGQQHVLQALTNALDNNRLHHAYLFTGTRGVGKTTLARILAKCLNCEQGVSSTPCGTCSTCSSIDEGRFVDLIEVDAASRAKVDETRDLMDNVQYAPSMGRYKVYLIDEVHMFSNHSFNALLKTLEEPPPHVKFLLATTESKKIPITILSRCLQFNLKLLSVDLIQQQLNKVVAEENIPSDAESIKLLARAADGSMRDALSLLDQAISYGGGQLVHDQIKTMLGAIDHREVSRLLQSVIDTDARSLQEQIEEMAEFGPDYDAILIEMLALLQKTAWTQLSDEHAQTEQDEDQVLTGLDAEQTQLFYQIALTGRRDLEYAPDQRTGFEMIMMRMLAFRLMEPQNPTVSKSSIPVNNQEPVKTSSAPAKTASAKKQMQQAHEPTQFAEESDAMDSSEWQDIIDEMALVGLVRELAGHCVLREHTTDKVHLVLSPSQDHLLKTNQKDRLESAIKTRFGEQVRLLISVEEPVEETPAMAVARKEKERQANAEKSINDDPNVRLLEEIFEGNLDHNSIRPSTKQ